MDTDTEIERTASSPPAQSLCSCELEPQSMLGGPSEDLSAGSTVGRDAPELKRGGTMYPQRALPTPSSLSTDRAREHRERSIEKTGTDE